MDSFDNSISDSQGTVVTPVDPGKFDITQYREYEQSLLENNKCFWRASDGIAVYRRFRAPEVFSYGCRDMAASLAKQLGGLAESIKYKADIANFLEPWYGIGTIASAFGVDYHWPEGQAPAIIPPFKTVKEALDRELIPIEETGIGKHTLNMIEYFLDKTKGKIPVSPTDTQSALNAASFLLSTDNFFMEMIANPEGMQELLKKIMFLNISFTQKQNTLIGDALVLPGHGFASSRVFKGLGMSSDVISMISTDFYRKFEAPCLEKTGENFGGAVFHSCGNWANKISGVKSVKNLVIVDGAFSYETDPDPNPCQPFAEQFRDTGVVVNARMVGNADTVIEKVKALWRPGIKLIVVTYCKTPAEQLKVYNRIQQITQGN